LKNTKTSNSGRRIRSGFAGSEKRRLREVLRAVELGFLRSVARDFQWWFGEVDGRDPRFFEAVNSFPPGSRLDDRGPGFIWSAGRVLSGSAWREAGDNTAAA
jgi:hypothetical protein